MRKVGLVVAALWCSVACATYRVGLDRDFAWRLMQTYTTVYSLGPTGNLGNGGGVYVSPNEVLTAAHVAGAASSVAWLDEEQSERLRVKKVRLEADLSLLTSPVESEHWASIGSNAETFDEVLIIGSPLGSASVPARGMVTGTSDGTFLIDVTTMHGNSGGPVFSVRTGRLVGIAFQVWGDSRTGGHMMVAVDAETLRDFVGAR